MTSLFISSIYGTGASCWWNEFRYMYEHENSATKPIFMIINRSQLLLFYLVYKKYVISAPSLAPTGNG